MTRHEGQQTERDRWHARIDDEIDTWSEAGRRDGRRIPAMICGVLERLKASLESVEDQTP